MSFGRPQTPLTPEQLQRQQRVGLGLSALSDVLSRRDPIANTLQRQAFLQENQQQQLQTQQQVQRLQNAGFTEQEINLFLAGVPPKDILGLRETTPTVSGEQIIENVEKNVEQTIEETNVLDTFADLSQAFGPIDAAQEGVSRLTRVLGFDVDPKTSAAVRARNSLNTEILANLAADFTGRPNMLIYENIRGNLPMTSATSENDAKEKYINIKDQVDARINNIKQGLKSTTVSDSDKEKYREELNKSILLSQKLDSAILSLSGKPKDVLEPDNVDFGMSGNYTGLYTNE